MSRDRFPTALALAAALVLAAACGRESAPPPPPARDAGTKMAEASRRMGEAARQGDVQGMGEAAKSMGEAFVGGVQVEPVDFRELKAVLPEKLAGLGRTSSEGSRTNFMGIATARALATYEDGKGARLEAEILDAGTLTGIASAAFAWIHVDIDREGDDGYERTITLGGRKGYESYSRRTRTGELDVVVAGRFIVSLRGTGVEMKDFRAAIAGLALERLDALKDRGAPGAPVASK